MQNKISNKAVFLILSVALLFGTVVHDQINATLNKSVAFECVGTGSYANINCYNSINFDPIYFLAWGIALIILALVSLRNKISKISASLILVNTLTVGILIHDQLNYSFNSNYCSGFKSYFYVAFFGQGCPAAFLDYLYFGLLFLATIIVIVLMLARKRKEQAIQ